MIEDVISLHSEAGRAEHEMEDGQKYPYPEFVGWQGERYLKKLLRQILPWSLYRTWEIFVDHQAQGNACYLGVTRLAEMAGRDPRTMEKNLASLCAKHLLIERAERRLFRSADGQTISNRVVVIKDFSGLYALAHDYHEWLADPNYIAPTRALMALVVQEPQLVARVRRFENYRRLLYHRPPGPGTKQREEDGWFLTYQPELSIQAEQAKRAPAMKNDPIPATLSANDLTKDLAMGSPKRRNERTMREIEERDSVDSIDPSFVLLEERESARVIVCDDAEGHAEAEHTTSASSALGPSQEGSPPLALQATLAGSLAASFLRIIAGPFGDRNPKGSQTRLCALVSDAPCSEPAFIIHCLVRAYLVARDTRTIRAIHCSPEGRANRMPLFLAMVQRFLGEAAPIEENGRAVQDALISDPCLAQWWNTSQIPLPSHVHGEDGTPEALQEAKNQEEQASETTETQRQAPWTPRLSQSDAEREARAALARRMLRQLVRMRIVLQDGIVLWEHLSCGCPLYHRLKGQDVCALCSPDPAWPAEVLVLLRSIVEPEGKQPQEDTVAPVCASSLVVTGPQECACWADRDTAYGEALRLLDGLISLGYQVEVFLELIGTGYQVVVRDDQSEWLCRCPEHIDALLAQVSQSAHHDIHEPCVSDC